MPTFVPHLQKNFKLTLADGIPEATVEQIGAVHWLRCCPLCGSVHQIQSVDTKAPYTPLCQTVSVLYKTDMLAWQKLHPDISQFTTLHLVQAAT